MKKTFFALTLLVGLLLPLAPRAQAETEVSLNFFYDNLSTEGNWIDVGDYGYCFQPSVAVSDTSWRPYADGYWAYTDAGWTWVSYEDFGWATYHYGRWTRLEDYGWVWVPGTEWAGAWVSWRTGGDYIGWAPLPPAAEPVYEGRAITGHVDVEFDIGPTFYNFVDVRYIGEPVLRQRLIEPSRNVTIINNTVNVTNITYNNTTVINSGPNFERVNRYSERPVKKMQLERETTIANLNLQGGARRNFNQVNGDQLRVIAPQLQKPTQKFAPKQVKATVKTPKIERGWTNVPDKEKLQARMRSEDAKNIPPPTIQPQQGRKAEAAAAEPKSAQPNDDNNNAAAQERKQQAARDARQNRADAGEEKANVREPRANPANEGANVPDKEKIRARMKGHAAQQAARAEQADQANAAKNANDAQAEQRAKRKAARAERAQSADEAKSNEQQQADKPDQRPARRAQRDEAPKAEAAADPSDNQNSGQPDRAQQTERRKARQENRAEPRAEPPTQPEAAQPEQAPARQQNRNRAPAEDAQPPQRAERPQQADRPDRAQRPQAARTERAQQPNEGPRNPPTERKRKKAAQEETPAQPQP